VERCVFFVPSDARAAVEQRLERLERARRDADLESAPRRIEATRT
jgi:hypothetical protein